MKNKEIFSKLQKHKERIIRQIEYRRLKRVGRKKTPQYTYCKNCGTKLDGMYFADPDLCPVVDVVFPEREVGLYVASGICLASAFCIADYLGGYADPLVAGLSSGCDLWTFMDLLLGL